MKIYVATSVRGFLVELFNKMENIEFEFKEGSIYEILTRKKIILNKIAKSKIISFLGIIRTITPPDNDFDLVFSYNKFLNTNKPYVIYLENPYALVNYSITKPYTFLGKKNISKLLLNPNLKAIVGLSYASTSTLKEVYNIPNHIIIKHIPPLISNQEKSVVDEKNFTENINCLYVSSRFELKGGADILTAFERLKALNITNIKLKIITDTRTIENKYRRVIEVNDNIDLQEFNLNKSELNSIYKKSHIILNPSRMDSFGLAIIEAMKFGVVPISTDLYAIPEFVKDGVNGYLLEPKYRFFKKNNFPNPEIWNNREKTIYSDYIDDDLVKELFNKLISLNNDREKLKFMSQNSYCIANTSIYSEDSIIEEWNKLFTEITL